MAMTGDYRRGLSLWDETDRFFYDALNMPDGRIIPLFGGQRVFQDDSHWRDFILFSEYFHGDNGAGLGASHQTGWTGLVARLIQQSGG
jgi:hypothetical protein